MQPLGTKKNPQPLGTKKITQLLGTQKTTLPFGTTKIPQLLGTKKNPGLLGLVFNVTKYTCRYANLTTNLGGERYYVMLTLVNCMLIL